MTAKIIAFANQKGGVGKTTSCVNLSAAIALLKQRVLLIDLDPQGNATMGSGFNKLDAKYTAGDVLQEIAGLIESIVSVDKFDLLPANTDVTEAEIKLIKQPDRQYKLHSALKIVAEKYDFIFIDCPPSLNILTLNALIAANSVIIPMQCEYYALEGLSSLMNTVEDINYSNKHLNKKLCIEGIIRTMYDTRNKLCKDVSSQLIEYFGDLVYSTVIPRNVRLAEAPSYGMPIAIYDASSKGAKSYFKLAKEILNKNMVNIKAKNYRKHEELELV